jgi:enoyl-CoA hydratase/carnithine racemase
MAPAYIAPEPTPVPHIGHAPAYFSNLREHFRDQGAGRTHLSMINRSVALIEFDNQKKANAFDGRMAAELGDAVDKLELMLGVHGKDKKVDEREAEKLKNEGKDLVAVIVAGRGKFFSAGFGETERSEVEDKRSSKAVLEDY